MTRVNSPNHLTIDRGVAAQRAFNQYRECPITGCWNWVGALDGNGYGHAWCGNGHMRAHRYVYEALIGALTDGLVLDHLCHNKRCVNPDHMRQATVRENTLNSDSLSAIRSRMTHCKNGHEFNETNTHITPRGQRMCRVCNNEWHKNKYATNEVFREYEKAKKRRKRAEKKNETAK